VLKASGSSNSLSSLLVQDTTDQYELPCDQLIVAIGQEPTDWLSRVRGLRIQKNGSLEVDPITWMTSIPKLFAAGDCVDRAKEVVNAVYEGKRAAQAIDGFLAQIR
jgi:glutamate synthase (NADPH/NADH) small chain